MVRSNQVLPSDPPYRDEVTAAALASQVRVLYRHPALPQLEAHGALFTRTCSTQGTKLKGHWTFLCKERVQCMCEGEGDVLV